MLKVIDYLIEFESKLELKLLKMKLFESKSELQLKLNELIWYLWLLVFWLKFDSLTRLVFELKLNLSIELK